MEILIPIGDIPIATTLDGSEMLLGVQGGNARLFPLTLLATYFGSTPPVTSDYVEGDYVEGDYVL